MTRAAPDLYFAPNSHTLDTRERRKIEGTAPGLRNLLRDFSDLIIVIEGHSDDRGRSSKNDRLVLERAEEVLRFLRNPSFPQDPLQIAVPELISINAAW